MLFGSLELLGVQASELQVLRRRLGDIMKKMILVAAVAAFGVLAQGASADVSGLTSRFGGGCNKGNTTGTCTVKVSASGTDLSSETVQLYVGKDAKSLKSISNRTTPLSTSGSAILRAKNVAGGCFQARTGPNGNDKPDASSRVICE